MTKGVERLEIFDMIRQLRKERSGISKHCFISKKSYEEGHQQSMPSEYGGSIESEASLSLDDPNKKNNEINETEYSWKDP
mmetsp:Transcript_15722/g.21598  ORF Transcript_15722/g.21598 Transcript_15722/m.21598 type:complete len:80 (-) Transcript_15722:701-940(-)